MRALGPRENKKLILTQESLLLDKISAKYGVNRGVVEYIAHYPFRCLRRYISGNEERPIRLRYLGVFTMKKSINKEKATENKIKIIRERYADYIVKAINRMYKEDIIKTVDEAISKLEELKNNKEYDKVEKAFKLCKSVKNFQSVDKKM